LLFRVRVVAVPVERVRDRVFFFAPEAVLLEGDDSSAPDFSDSLIIKK
jgi:hypothetical protein